MSRVAKAAIAFALVSAAASLLRRLNHSGDSEQVLREYYEALSGGDADAVRDLLTDDYAGHVHTFSGTEDQDARALAKRIKSHKASFEKINYDVEDVVCHNGEVAARLTMRARHKESGKKAKTTGLAILRIEDGKIAEEWSSWDYHGLAAQLGLE